MTLQRTPKGHRPNLDSTQSAKNAQQSRLRKKESRRKGVQKEGRVNEKCMQYEGRVKALVVEMKTGERDKKGKEKKEGM